ncbi:MAG: hypothetical protein AAGA55_00465 [Planctomycetota bacterium]
MPSPIHPVRRCLTIAALGTTLAALSGCQLHKRLPWVSTETILASDPALPPIVLEAANNRHVVAFRATSGGWTISIDRTDIVPDATRLYVTIRRPDPAFSHTQALVDLHALSNTPIEQPVELVARVLEHDAEPKDRIYARVTPADSLDG